MAITSRRPIEKKLDCHRRWLTNHFTKQLPKKHSQGLEDSMIDFSRKNDFLIGIDSDGCVFDTMELKHKECFIPNTINYWDLQGVSKYAREAAEFVNLYSTSRGINRFPALIEVLDWLRRRPEVKARKMKIAEPTALVEWIEKETKLGNPALIKAVEETGDETLRRTLEWSEAVNQSVTDMVRGVPPFPFVRECLVAFAEKADILVVSATPNEALHREWERTRAGRVRRVDLWSGDRHEERDVGDRCAVRQGPYVDDRRRAGRF